MKFERGLAPKKCMDIGLDKRYPKPGDSFRVKFNIRESRPEFYAIQKENDEGKLQIAVMLEEFNSHMIKYVKCYIKALGKEHKFYADWNELCECWAIG